MSETLLSALLNATKNYIHNPESISLITKAFNVADLRHKGQLRKSKEPIPYIVHPVGVAMILTELEAGPITLAAALLHDTLEDTTYTREEMISDFSEEMYELVDGVTKIGRLKFKTDLAQAEYHRKMLLATAKDIRVVLIKIADRLHNIRTLEELPLDRQKAIANETLEIYAPLAHRLGLFKIKAELEDTALKYIDHEMYYYVSGLIQSKKSEREDAIKVIIDDIKAMLKDNGIKTYTIKGRIKSIYSIYKKMILQQRDFEDIYDLLAIRIICSDIAECYKILGLIHANYIPIPKRFKDYIAMPKPNMYQSLHTTVIAKDAALFEVQIRTQEMDNVAEMGIAAHWAYKENKSYSKEKEQFEMAQKLKWYADLLKVSSDKDEQGSDPISFVESVKTEILNANVYVFTPNGKVIELASGSTPIDFAYKIHTQVGNTMIGCLINNKIAPLDSVLKTGDIISIKTAKSGNPSADWLKICKTTYAKNKIRAELNKLNYDSLYAQGKASLEKELERNQITIPLDDKFVKTNFKKQGYSSLDVLYLEIAKGTVSVKSIINKIITTQKTSLSWLYNQLKKANTNKDVVKHSDQAIIINGISNPQFRFANCCLPIYGDEIVGYVSKVNGFIIHHRDCPNCKKLQNERKIEVEWNTELVNKTYSCWLMISTSSSDKIISKIISLLSLNKVSFSEINAQASKEIGSVIKLKINIQSLKKLESIISNIKKIQGVYDVSRGLGI